MRSHKTVIVKQYFEEGGKEINQTDLLSQPLPQDIYSQAHRGLVITCHDVFITLDGGVLLVKRDNVPAKDEFFPIGGRINRGLTLEESVMKKAKEECNLDVTNLTFLGVGRTAFQTDPFGHEKGTDTLNVVIFAHGSGTLKIDKLHSSPLIVKPSEYPELRPNLHPYVRDFMDIAIELC